MRESTDGPYAAFPMISRRHRRRFQCMTDTLSALDATFLELEQEDDAALMSIGGVLVFVTGILIGSS